MRSLVSAAMLALALTACGGGGDGGGGDGDAAGGETFDAKGTVSITGAADSEIFAPDGSATGDPCESFGVLADFSTGKPVVVVDDGGAEVARGEIGDGTLPERAKSFLQAGFEACELPFTVGGIPEAGGPFTLRVGPEETTFTQDEAASLAIEVSSDSLYED